MVLQGGSNYNPTDPANGPGGWEWRVTSLTGDYSWASPYNDSSGSPGSIASIGDLGYHDSQSAADGQASSTIDAIANTAIGLIGKIWNLPNDALGIGLGLLDAIATVPFAIAGNASWPGLTFGDNALQFTNLKFGFGALPLGNVQLFISSFGPDSPTDTYWGREFNPGVLGIPAVGIHEEAHTFQSQVLGPFFLPAYLLSGSIHRYNAFENAADVFALTGTNWWPW